MKKLFTALLMLPMLFAGCEYDDSELKNKVDDLDDRLTAVEAQVKSMNQHIQTLQQLLDQKLFITSVVDNGDGSWTLGLITASGEASSVTIRNGKDGENGADGKDGSTPEVGVRQDSDGRYYWTVNGEWVTDKEGNKLPVTGNDGKPGQDGKPGEDGEDGQPGQDAVTPTFKIEDGKWWVSYDHGMTYIECGKATGDDGDAFFKDARLSDDGRLAYLTLADGTVLTFEIYREFNIAFEVGNLLIMSGESKEIPFTLTGADEKTQVEAIGKNGFEAEVVMTGAAGGKLVITAPQLAVTGKVIVLVSDGADKTLMRTLTFVAGHVSVSTSSVEAPAEGGRFEVEVTTNLEFTVSLPEEAGWVRLSDDTRAYEVRTEKLTLDVDANDTPYARSAMLTLRQGDLELETILIYQKATVYDEQIMVLRVQPDEQGNVKLPFYACNAAVTIDWGDGSEPSVIETMKNSSTRYPAHVYENRTKQYTVQVTGGLTSISASSASYSKGLIDIVQWGKLPLGSIQLQYNNAITRLPAPVEGAFERVSSMKFYNCKGLRSIEKGFLDSAPSLSNLTDIFSGCESLEEVPDDLFDKCTSVTSARAAFKNCKKLTRAVSMKNTKLSGNNINSLYSGCESLVYIPEDLFPETVGTTSNGNINNMFSDCKSLESVPAGLFRHFGEKVTNVSSLFNGCEKLKTLDFSFINQLKNCYNWSSAFAGCPLLTGKIPTYPLEIDGQTVEVELWERGNAEYKSYFGNRSISGSNCFNGSVSLDGYYDHIPQSWGGGWDGTTEAPTISVTASLPEGAAYYAVDFQVKGTGVAKARYYLSSKASADKLLPQYNNSYAELCDANGIEIESDYIASINSENGLTLYFDQGIPETEYILIISGSNMFGKSYAYDSKATTPIPAGKPEYDRYLGQWTVTSQSSTSTSLAYEPKPVSFDIRIEPLRVDESYIVYGWGVTQFSQYPCAAWFEDGELCFYSGAPKGMLIYTGYPFTDDFGSISYNVAIIPYGFMNGAYSTYQVTPEKVLQGSFDNATQTATLSGVRSEYFTDGDVYCAGMDAFLTMGGPGWSRTFMPVDIVKPEYVTTVGEERLAPYTLAPYTLTRSTAAAAPKAMTRPHHDGTASLKVRFGKQSAAAPQPEPVRIDPIR